MEVRVAIIEDFPIVQALFQELFSLLPKRQVERWPQTREGQEYLLTHIHAGHVVVADVQNQVHGYLLWSIRQALPFQTFNQYAELQSMYVSESHRNEGIGTKLCEVFFNVCAQDHIDTILVESAVLPETVRFYEKQGFIEERKVMFFHRSNPNKTNLF